MTILVSGSVAFDHIMTFPQKFADHILPEKLDDLNVAFNITDWQTHFGGTGGNIGFCLRLLGEDPLILATVGTDFGPYGDWFDRHAISREGLRVFDDVRSPQGFVTTDIVKSSRSATRGFIQSISTSALPALITSKNFSSPTL